MMIGARMKTNIWEPLAIVLLIVFALELVIPLVAVNLPRRTAIQVVMTGYAALGSELPPAGEHFQDISGLAEREAIEQAYALGITAGTGADTFSPESKMRGWQWLIFIGKAIMLLEQNK